MDGGVTKDACSIGNAGVKSWVVGAVTKTVPKHVRRRENRFENLVDEKDGDDEEEDEVVTMESSDDGDRGVGP
eukprot:12196087-Karenia_brevis.AAC.1